MKILLTGATGFIGQRFLKALLASGYQPRLAVRRPLTGDLVAGTEQVVVGDIGPDTDWQKALAGVDVVVHLAALAHVVSGKDPSFAGRVRKVNVDAVRSLAQAALASKVRRLVYVSSVKVNGEQTTQSFTEQDAPDPQDIYGTSKRDAEEALRTVASGTSLEIVIVRPPLVYGPGVKANFRGLLRLAASGWPLPLAGLHNKRSFVYVDNLASAMLECMRHPRAAGEVFLVSDGEDVSTPELIRLMARSLSRPARLFYVPEWVFGLIFTLMGRAKDVQKLTGSLCVDSGKIRRLLGWTPPYTLEQGIRATVTGEKI
jgi:nucleoside-diphosphate-sugar epimerase